MYKTFLVSLRSIAPLFLPWLQRFRIMSVLEKKDYEHSAEDGVQQYTGLKALYYHPITQVVMLGFVCFMGPGLFNALNGLGGGGQLDATTSANANAALYATFAFAAFFAGSVLLIAVFFLSSINSEHIPSYRAGPLTTN